MSGLLLKPSRSHNVLQCARCGRTTDLGLCHICGRVSCETCRLPTALDRLAAQFNALLFEDTLIRCDLHPPPRRILLVMLGGVAGLFVSLLLGLLGFLPLAFGLSFLSLVAMLVIMIPTLRQPPAPRTDMRFNPWPEAIESYTYHLDILQGTVSNLEARLSIVDRQMPLPGSVEYLRDLTYPLHQGGLVIQPTPQATQALKALVANGPLVHLYTQSGKVLAETGGQWPTVQYELEAAPTPLNVTMGWDPDAGRTKLYIEFALLPPYQHHTAWLEQLILIIPAGWPLLRADHDMALERLEDGSQQVVISGRPFPIIESGSTDARLQTPRALQLSLQWSQDVDSCLGGAEQLSSTLRGAARVTMGGSLSGAKITWQHADGRRIQPIQPRSNIHVGFAVSMDALPASYHNILKWPSPVLIALPPSPEVVDSLADAIRQQIAPLGPHSYVMRIEESPVVAGMRESAVESRQWTLWGRVYNGLIPVIFRISVQGDGPGPTPPRGDMFEATPVVSWTTLTVALQVESGQLNNYTDALFRVDQALWDAIQQAQSDVRVGRKEFELR